MTKTIVITGAGGVLGKHVARTFAERGDNLALLGRDKGKLEALARDLNLPADRHIALEADLSDGEAVRASVDAVLSKFGAIHGLIHLVGGWTGGRALPDSDPKDLAFMLSQHAFTTYHLFRNLAPHLAGSREGRVVVVSNPVASQPVAKSALYAAAKAAQESLTLTLAEEFKENGLTANVIQVRSIDVKGEGKGTTPAEIGAAILYLFSTEANKVNGARIPLY
ncbi:MAG: SDR family oxidoreductase [Chloroflexi bacterium]|nr:SDR family oxidoreductase [Chloroflexota bacterium]